MTFIKSIVRTRKNNLNHKISGTLYGNREYHKTIANYMFDQYMFSNPLHTDLYPELNKMESEIVKMIGNLFDLPKTGGGNLTTGGTESTILAIKAYKKYKNAETRVPKTIPCSIEYPIVGKYIEKTNSLTPKPEIEIGNKLNKPVTESNDIISKKLN